LFPVKLTRWVAAFPRFSFPLSLSFQKTSGMCLQASLFEFLTLITKRKLRSNDDQEFTVDRDVIEISLTIKHLLDDIGETDAPIPMTNISGKTLEKIIEYCEHYKQFPTPVNEDDRSLDDISPWDREFCAVEQVVLFDLILAANYLDIKPLLDLTCKTVALMIKGKTAEEIRKTFHIRNDFTPEEEEQVRKENLWCEER